MGASLLSSLTGFPAPTVTASVREENARSTKHFERWLHYVRELRQRLVISMHLVPDSHMVSDIFTKPLYRAKFSWCRDYLLNRS